MLPCSCSRGCAIDSGADGGDPQAEVLGSIRGAEAAGESRMSKPMSLGVVQSRCASRGVLLLSISANVIRRAFAACPLQLLTRLKASKPWQPALDEVVERSCRAGIRSRARHHGQRQRRSHANEAERQCRTKGPRPSDLTPEPRRSRPIFPRAEDRARDVSPHATQLQVCSGPLAHPSPLPLTEINIMLS